MDGYSCLNRADDVTYGALQLKARSMEIEMKPEQPNQLYILQVEARLFLFLPPKSVLPVCLERDRKLSY